MRLPVVSLNYNFSPHAAKWKDFRREDLVGTACVADIITPSEKRHCQRFLAYFSGMGCQLGQDPA